MKNFNRDLFGERNAAFEGDTAKPVIRFSAEKFVIGTNLDGPTQTATEDEAYCPPTPVPKKSILKDPNVTSTEKKKQVNKNGIEYLRHDLYGLKKKTNTNLRLTLEYA